MFISSLSGSPHHERHQVDPGGLTAPCAAHFHPVDQVKDRGSEFIQVIFQFHALEVDHCEGLSPICGWTAGRRKPGAAAGNHKQMRK